MGKRKTARQFQSNFHQAKKTRTSSLPSHSVRLHRAKQSLPRAISTSPKNPKAPEPQPCMDKWTRHKVVRNRTAGCSGEGTEHPDQNNGGFRDWEAPLDRASLPTTPASPKNPKPQNRNSDKWTRDKVVRSRNCRMQRRRHIAS